MRTATQTARPATAVSAPRERIELSAGSATAQGVTVQQVRVGPEVGHIVIYRSRAVQVGDGNRQLNNFNYRIERPRVSVDDLLSGSPARLRAFENLVDRPNSVIANWTFRHQMAAEASPPGPVRFISSPAPRTTRVAARLDERGQVVVSRSRGVQVASGSTQRNDFSYRVVKPDLSLEPMLRDNPQLARSLALTARYPGNAAVQRLFTDRVTRSYAGPARSSLSIPPGSAGLSVSGSTARTPFSSGPTIPGRTRSTSGCATWS